MSCGDETPLVVEDGAAIGAVFSCVRLLVLLVS